MEEQVDHYYLSAAAYAKKTGVNPETVKAWIKTGQLEGKYTEGQYKVKVFKNGSVSYEEHSALLKKYAEAETQLNLIKNILIGQSLERR